MSERILKAEITRTVDSPTWVRIETEGGAPIVEGYLVPTTGEARLWIAREQRLRAAIIEEIAVKIEGMALGESVEIMGARMDWREYDRKVLRANAARIARSLIAEDQT